MINGPTPKISLRFTQPFFFFIFIFWLGTMLSQKQVSLFKTLHLEESYYFKKKKILPCPPTTTMGAATHVPT